MSTASDHDAAPEWVRTAHDAADLLLGERPGVLLVGAPSHTGPVVGFILDRLSVSPLSPVPFTAAEATSETLRDAVERSQAARTAPGNALLLVIRDAESLSPALLDELELAATAAAEHGGLKFLFAARHELAPTLRRAGHATLSDQLRTRLLVRAPMRSPETGHVVNHAPGPVLAARHAVSRDMRLPGILLAGSVLAALALTLGIAHQLLHRQPLQLAGATRVDPLPAPVRPDPPVAAAPQRQAMLLPAVPPVAPEPVRPVAPIAVPGQRSPAAAVLPPPGPGLSPPSINGPVLGRVASSTSPTATQPARPAPLTPSPQQQAVLPPAVPVIRGVPSAPLEAPKQPPGPLAFPAPASGTVGTALLPARPGELHVASLAPPPPVVAPPVRQPPAVSSNAGMPVSAPQRAPGPGASPVTGGRPGTSLVLPPAPRDNRVASSTPPLPAVAQPGQAAQQPMVGLPAAPGSPNGFTQDRHVAPAPAAAPGPIPLHPAGPAQTVQPAASPAVRQQALPSPVVPAKPGVAAVPDTSRQATTLSAPVTALRTSHSLPAGPGALSAPPSELSHPNPAQATQLALAVPPRQPATLSPAGPQPDQPAASAGQQQAAFVPFHEPASRPSASLLILAGPGDTLSSLYKEVYRGTIPPPFREVSALNRVTVRPGTRLIFPSPPRGWPRQSQSRR